MNHEQHFRQLDSLLAEYAWLWRPQPFKTIRPEWCSRLPKLCESFLSLPDGELAWLTDSAAALNTLLADHLPDLKHLDELVQLPEYHPTSLPDLGPHFANGIPGRKWQQVTSFTAAVGEVQMPVLDWCGGKGHLGRVLAAQWRQPVLTLDHDAGLCDQGRQLAQRAHASQTFCVEDALASSVAKIIADRHTVALHACGELHRTLVRRSVATNVPALDIAPCCYHLLGDDHYQPFNSNTLLKLGRDDLRLAVTETVTAVGREVRLRDREMAWKLGFDLLRRRSATDGHYRPIKPIDKDWLKKDFADFCRVLAIREEQDLPPTVDWPAAEAAGWQRQHDTMRLSLVRHAFRRAIEVWLVLDMATFIEQHGYEVQIGSFCDCELTPRNILLSARRLCD